MGSTIISTEGIAEEWIARMKSGAINKGNGALKVRDYRGVKSLCAQGVLAEILVERGILTEEFRASYTPNNFECPEGWYEFAFTPAALEKFAVSAFYAQSRFARALPDEVFPLILGSEGWNRIAVRDAIEAGIPRAEAYGSDMPIWRANDFGMSLPAIAESLEKRMVKA